MGTENEAYESSISDERWDAIDASEELGKAKAKEPPELEDGDRVEGMTWSSISNDRAPARIEGRLKLRHVEALDYWQWWIDGIQVNPATVNVLTENSNPEGHNQYTKLIGDLESHAHSLEYSQPKVVLKDGVLSLRTKVDMGEERHVHYIGLPKEGKRRLMKTMSDHAEKK